MKRSHLLAVLALPMLVIVMGCGGSGENQVIQAPPQSQAEVDAYEKQMNETPKYEK